MVAATSSGKDRIVATLLLAFVPCSARSAIILAMGGKYLGALGVFAIFALTFVVLTVLGGLLARRYADLAVGLIQEIPPYALPRWRGLLAKTWERTRDIVTIVTPLLVAGSVLLALLNHFGADRTINFLLSPITHWWLGLPVLLGVPILFGVLRKELSLADGLSGAGGRWKSCRSSTGCRSPLSWSSSPSTFPVCRPLR
jgi:ferrous iron transport protein B